MAPKVAVLRSNMNSIFANLSAEEALIHQTRSSAPTLFFWRNSPTVVIGRHQNPWKECNLSKMDGEKVALARRYSGGGAVYHDLGCSIFTFINRLEGGADVSRIIDTNFEILEKGLKRAGFNVSRKGRNDLVVDGSTKVSGSAFKQNADVLVHHGTILVNTDLTKLSQFLTPSKLKIESKGISSVRARVSNLADIPNPSSQERIDHDTVCDVLTKEFRKQYSCSETCDPDFIDSRIPHDEMYQDHYSRLQNWSWRYGSSPEFSNYLETRIDGVGCFDVHFQVINGKITKARIFTDILYPDLVEALESSLVNVEYHRSAIEESLLALGVTLNSPERKHVIQAFTQWLVEQI